MTNAITALASLFSLAQSGISAAEQYASVAPTIEKGVEAVASSGKAVANDIGVLIADLRAGKYASTEADVARALTDFATATAAIASALPAVASLVGKAPSLPTVGGITAILKTL